ncbi:MAG TPA: lysophospholipid acyltransferase family protein [Anaerolineales bacterium]|nr:lysophospholipid acyltransferase family protein [Anaerolineales bacterium]
MQTPLSSPPKPVTDWWRPDLVKLPRLTLARRIFRVFMRGLSRLLVLITMDATINGLENFPEKGPALVVINHLGDADAVLLAAAIPVTLDGMGKIELSEHWLVGPVFRAYGVIYVHRGRPDRRAIRAALEGLAEGRMITLAPEGRQALDGRLEDGTNGAAFLAMKSGAEIVPIAMTGTENENIYGHLRKWKRARVTLSVGKPFKLQEQADRQKMLREGTRQIMESLADLLPESYRGNYNVNS